MSEELVTLKENKPFKERTKRSLKDLFILIRMQLSEKLKWKRDADINHKLGVIGKRFGGMAVAYGLFVALFYVVFKVLYLTPSEELFTFFIAVLQLISIITCTIQASHLLYTSKDNSLLLTYPIRHVYVFISKIVVMYILELLKSLILILPLFMAYMTIVPGVITANYVVVAILYSIFLPLMPVMIGTIFSIPFVYLTKVFKKASWVKGIFSILLFGGLITATVFIVLAIQSVGQIRIMALSNELNQQLIKTLGEINKYTLYANLVGKSMYTKEYGVAALYTLAMFGVILGTIIVSTLISLPCFYKLASSVSENATQKKHKGENVAHNSTFVTFLRKELILSIRNISNFASDYAFLFAMPFVLIIITTVFVHIDRNELGYCMTYGFLGLLTLVMLCASNTASATTISSEGNEFVLLKTAPGKTSNIIWSKLLINFIIALLATAISYGILNILLIPDIAKGYVDAGKLWLVFGYTMIIEVGLLLWSIQLDIVNPKLREFANSKDKSEIKNSSSSIVIGLIFSVIFSLLLIGAFILKIPFYVSALLLIAVALIFLGLRFYFLIQYRNAFFEDIQL